MINSVQSVLRVFFLLAALVFGACVLEGLAVATDLSVGDAGLAEAVFYWVPSLDVRDKSQSLLFPAKKLL